ncbi:type II secretion system F family protein [Micromonospora sp. NPDC049903]|uniref:type II secretion system F family protein n=1 Tax=Micromonospora sp. NPDC049903 TaxID=3364276 RepID=UPI0037A32F71
MTDGTLAAAVLVGVVLIAVVLVGRRRPRRRLRRLAGASPSTATRRGSGADGPPGPASTASSSRSGGRQKAAPPVPGAGAGRRVDRVRLAAGLAGVAVAVLVGGWPGLVAALPTALLLDRLLRRIEPPADRNRRLRAIADLPLAADLLAAALRAGAPVERSVLAVADALGGPLADHLGRVGRTLQLGGGPQEAWAHLATVPGAQRIGAAAIRSASSGAALAGALTRLADDLRADRAIAIESAARRAGVLIVLPLGLCFLPAFILAGLVPVIVAVLGDVL